MEGGEQREERPVEDAEEERVEAFDLQAGLPPLKAYLDRYVTYDWGPNRTPQVRAAFERYLLDASGLQREELSERENEVLTWLLGWDDYTLEPIGHLFARASGLDLPPEAGS